MVAVVSTKNVSQVIKELEAAGEKVYTIGKVVPRSSEGCVLLNLSSWD